MTLVINIVTPAGIVMAADSRQSYRNQKGMSRIGSDSASKVFQLNQRLGLSVSGVAFINDGGVLKNVGDIINTFREDNNLDGVGVKEVAGKIHDLFDGKLEWRTQLDLIETDGRKRFSQPGKEIVEIVREQYRVKFTIRDTSTGQVQDIFGAPDGVAMVVSGYNTDGSHAAYVVAVPGEVTVCRDSQVMGRSYGADWLGQGDVVNRIIKGWDARIMNLDFVREAVNRTSQSIVDGQLNQLEYSINWGTMTLQDAIDFSVLAIRTTEAVQKFSDGIVADPGDMPGVGGPVDVLVLTPRESFWAEKKQIKSEQSL